MAALGGWRWVDIRNGNGEMAMTHEGAGMSATVEVQTLSDTKQVAVLGETLGDLRRGIKTEFGTPTFEQKIMYDSGNGAYVELNGDDSVPLKEKPGLLHAKMLQLSRQVDPRYKTEKETAFLTALQACRFQEATDLLESSGVTIDPNCILKRGISTRIAVTECPFQYAHPALTVAMMAGLENAVQCLKCSPDKINTFMSQEKELCQLVELMIQKNADVNAIGDETQDCESAGHPTVRGKTPLCAAIQRGSPALVRILLDAKADPNHQHKYDATAWGPDTRNPLGPGNLKPESWLQEICNGSVSQRDPRDPRIQRSQEILEMLHAAA